jgi:hypothetical protein
LYDNASLAISDRRFSNAASSARRIPTDSHALDKAILTIYEQRSSDASLARPRMWQRRTTIEGRLCHILGRAIDASLERRFIIVKIALPSAWLSVGIWRALGVALERRRSLIAQLALPYN